MNNKPDIKRRSRYRRADIDNRVPGRYQDPGDTEIIKLVHEYKMLTRQLLEHLTGRKDKAIKRRLRFLFDHEYLNKLYFSKTYVEFGSAPDIYVLDRRGREEYQARTGEKADHSPLRNQNKDPQLEHTLLVNTIRTLITTACKDKKNIELLRWERESRETKDYVKLANGRKWPIAPDAFFTLKVDNEIWPFFLEADRSSLDRSRMKKKYQAYYLYLKSIREEVKRQKRQKAGKINLSEKFKFNVPTFRVLTVIEHRDKNSDDGELKRLNTLIQTALTVGKEGQGWGGLLFTCKSRIDIKNPDSILEPIWQIGYLDGDKSPEELHALTEKL